jgi:hypothetical protein
MTAHSLERAFAHRVGLLGVEAEVLPVWVSSSARGKGRVTSRYAPHLGDSDRLVVLVADLDQRL